MMLFSICRDEEPPVQGPINKEPEDKLHPERKPSGIRKL